MSAGFPLTGTGHLIDPRNGRESAVQYEIEDTGGGCLWGDAPGDVPYAFSTICLHPGDVPWILRDSDGKLWRVVFADSGTNLEGPITISVSKYEG